MDEFPFIVPQEYTSSFETNLTSVRDERSAFESVKKAGFINDVRQVLEDIEFTLNPFEIEPCLEILKKNQPFRLKITPTESIIVKCLNYTKTSQGGNKYRYSSPNLYEFADGMVFTELYTLSLKVKQIFKP